MFSARGMSSSDLFWLWGEGWEDADVFFKSDCPGSKYSLRCAAQLCIRYHVCKPPVRQS